MYKVGAWGQCRWTTLFEGLIRSTSGRVGSGALHRNPAGPTPVQRPRGVGAVQSLKAAVPRPPRGLHVGVGGGGVARGGGGGLGWGGLGHRLLLLAAHGQGTTTHSHVQSLRTSTLCRGERKATLITQNACNKGRNFPKRKWVMRGSCVGECSGCVRNRATLNHCFVTLLHFCGLF